MDTALTYAEYLCTAEGDRLLTLAAAYAMTFEEKLRWSEACWQAAADAAVERSRTLEKALAQWAER